MLQKCISRIVPGTGTLNNICLLQHKCRPLDSSIRTVGLCYGVPKESIEKDLEKIKIAGTGNPYETQIKRRREVVDPSVPNFDQVECLKWTNWRMNRDVKRRHIHASYAQYRVNLKNLASCHVLPSTIRDTAADERLDTPRYSSVNCLVNRCAISSRPRGNLQQWRLSRIIWRDLADHGLISGAIRAKWG